MRVENIIVAPPYCQCNVMRSAILMQILYFLDNVVTFNILEPEPLLNKVNAVDVIFCYLALFVQPRLALISERDDENIFFGKHSRNTHVGNSCSRCVV